MSSTHTPGPWVASSDIYAKDGDGSGIVRLAAGTSDADARLIASAPDLLEALKLVVEDDESYLIPMTYNSVMEAIKKATGES